MPRHATTSSQFHQSKTKETTSPYSAHNITTQSQSPLKHLDTQRQTHSITMKSTCAIVTLCLATSAQAFTALTQPTHFSCATQRLCPLNSYVPAGLSAAEYQKIKEADMKKTGNNLGRLGPRGFKSRSMQAWQEAYERGEAEHAIAPFGYREALKRGELKKKDVPYMVRGGSWDNSDVAGAKRKRWLPADREYTRGGYKKEQSVSILGSGPGFDWTGSRPREENLRKLVPGLS